MQHLLLPIAETRRTLKALRGSYRKRGSTFIEAFTAHLDSHKDTDAWRGKAEYLALGAMYLEQRGRGGTFYLEGTVQAVREIMRKPIPAKDKYHLLKLTACPFTTLHEQHWTWSHMYVNRDNRRFPYPSRKTLEYLCAVLPVAKDAGVSIIRLLPELLVDGWLTHHKDIWTVEQETYLCHVNVESWDNVSSSDFVEKLIKVHTKQMEEGSQLSSWMSGILSRADFLARAPEVINAVSELLGVDIEQVELSRVFGEFLGGECTAESLATGASIWPGLKNQEFVRSASVLAASPDLLNLISPKRSLEALLGKGRRELLLDVLLELAPDEYIAKAKAEMTKCHLELDLIPVTREYKIEDFDELLCEAHNYYSYEKNPVAEKALLGVRSLLLDSMSLEFGHQAVSKKILADLIPQAESALEGLIGNNAVHIKTARKLFESLTSLENREKLENEDEDDYYTSRYHQRKAHKIAGVSIDKLDLTSNNIGKIRVPAIANVMIRELKKRLQGIIADRVSDIIDGDWRTLQASTVSFED